MRKEIKHPASELKNARFTQEELDEATLEYFNGDELAAHTWRNKYALREPNGVYLELTPDDMHQRLAQKFYQAEKAYTPVSESDLGLLSAYGQERKPLDERAIYEMFRDFRYLVPQGSVMASLGNPTMLASLSNCIVLPEIEDSFGGIFYADQQMAQLFKRRCGVGMDISSLRPEGTLVSNSAGSSTGAVSFMERFSNTTREVAQNGRRGALMITMDIAHPDIEAFIEIKQDLRKVTGANISIRISDAFMKAVENKATFKLRWPIDAKKPLIEREIDALKLWEKINTCAWRSAEPGLIFWDTQHHYSTSSVYPGFKNLSTNPCSEIAMQGGDSCRLMAINLYNFVQEPFSEKANFDMNSFYRITYEGQRLMDDLVDLEVEAVDRILAKIDEDPEPEAIKFVEREVWETLKRTGKNGRRTGLGFTALADVFAALGFAYDSDEALAFAEQMMKTKCRAEFDSSIDMAVERGAFDAFDPEIEKTSNFVKMLEWELPEIYQRMMALGRRNISISTVAPTGTLSMLTQSSSGIEPVFMLSYTRRKKINPGEDDGEVDFVDEMGDSWREFTVLHPKLKVWMEKNKNQDINESPYASCTANKIDWHKRISLQAIVQKYITHSISSTINLPADVEVDDVSDIFYQAWKKGLKGITVYRDGSRSGVLIAENEKQESRWADSIAPDRPGELEADIIHFKNKNESWIAFIGLLDGRPYEIFTGRAEDSFALPTWVQKGWITKVSDERGSSRYDFRYLDKHGYKVTIEGLSRSFDEEYWNYAKLISGILRQGMPLPQVVHLINHLQLYNESINTWKNGVERALKRYVPDGTRSEDRFCRDCGDPDGLYYEEGCLKCKSCGTSKCG